MENLLRLENEDDPKGRRNEQVALSEAKCHKGMTSDVNNGHEISHAATRPA